MHAVLLSLLFTQIPMEVFERTEAFTVIDSSGPITMSARPVAGSAFKEYRARTTVAFAAEPLCAFIFDWGTKKGDGPGITHNEVLVDGDHERVVYQQISQPVVSKRDFAFTSVHQPAANGVPCRVRFRVTNNKAPAKPDGFVRMDKMWGEWIVEPSEKGSVVTYTLFSDPAGSIPAFLVHGPARDATKDALIVMMDRAGKSLVK